MSFEPRRRSRRGVHPLNATALAAALALQAEDVCRRYLPGGRRQGNYWTAGDTGGGPDTLAARIGPLFAPGVASVIAPLVAAIAPAAAPETRNGGELGSVPA